MTEATKTIDVAERDSWQPTWSSTASWVLYDLANTVFALGVGSRYFSLWVVEAQGRPDSYVGFATIAAMVAVILIAPWIGAISDYRGHRRFLLTGLTLVAVGATALLATGGVIFSLVVYAIGSAGFHLATVVYDALLVDVSTEKTRGKVSGIGVSVGYAGSLIALGIGVALLESHGYAVVFRALAAAFLLFALPAFLFIRERPKPPQPGRAPSLLETPKLLVSAWKLAGHYRGVVPFLFGRFLYTDAMNTAFLFNAIYVKQVLGYSDLQTDGVALLAITTAMLGAIAAGRIVDRIGPARVLNAALYSLIVGMVAGVVAGLAHIPALGVVTSAAGGLGVGAVWASDRVYMTTISPPRRLGELFGLYASVGRFATVLGPLVWAFVVDVAGWGRPVAVGALGLFLVIARFVLRSVDDTPREWGADELVSA